MPCLVYKMCIGTYREHLYSHPFQQLVLVGQVFQLCRTYECEIGGIEEEKRPLPFNVFVGNGLELPVLKSLDGKLGCVCIDNWFHI